MRDAFMISILILLALSALSGFVLGIGYFSWPAILAAGAVLAPLSTVVLQNQDFGALSGISVIVACLTINQAAYVVGAIPCERWSEGRLCRGSTSATSRRRTRRWSRR
jgi:hypothetical protein